MLRRILTLICLACVVWLTGCSTVSLAYNQAPRLLGWWVDGYLDLDRGQRRQFDGAVAELLAWHRREELPRWLALVKQADTRFAEGPMTEADLLQLEDSARASVERTLQHAAPLAVPLLASLKPAQWQHLQARQAKDLAEWRKQQSGNDGHDERATQFQRGLSRWLGDLDRAPNRLARSEALAWRPDVETLSRDRAARQAAAVEALHAWAAGDTARGNQLMAQQLSRESVKTRPAELAYRQAVTASVLHVLASFDAHQREKVHAHWAGWMTELRQLQQAR
jgi:hypothetical protein